MKTIMRTNIMPQSQLWYQMKAKEGTWSLAGIQGKRIIRSYCWNRRQEHSTRRFMLNFAIKEGPIVIFGNLKYITKIDFN